MRDGLTPIGRVLPCVLAELLPDAGSVAARLRGQQRVAQALGLLGDAVPRAEAAQEVRWRQRPQRREGGGEVAEVVRPAGG